MPMQSGRRPGCHLTNLSGNQAIAISSSSTPEIDAAQASKKQSWLPLLTVLFLISYGLMTMLIVEQGRTIESQRSLIRRAVPRQPGVVSRKEGPAGERSTGGSDPSPGNAESVDPNSVDPESVEPVPVNVPVNPGTQQTGPVFPGRTASRTATWQPERSIQAETAGSHAVETSIRPGG